MNDECQITVKEFCRRYGVGVTTTYKLLSEGALSAVRYGHRTLIDLESAEAWRRSLPTWDSVPQIVPQNRRGLRRKAPKRREHAGEASP
jgi:excisionase family DNA binding protein